MQNVDDIIFSGGLNTDDDPRMFQKGDYLEARNIQISSTQEQGDDGLVKTIKSTLEIILPSILNGIQDIEHYGVSVDEEKKMAYILSIGTPTNDDDYFIIFKHNLITNNITTIFMQLASTWGMNKWDSNMQKMYNPKIIDNNLIWTDNVNDIRMINVDRAETSLINGISSSRVYNQSFAISPGYEVDTIVNINGENWKVIQQTFGEILPPGSDPAYYEYYNMDSIAQWSSNISYYSPGYEINTLVYYQDYVYIVTQSTVSAPTNPSIDPTRYTPLCRVVDCYLNLRTPNNFTLAALPPLIAPTVTYFSDESRVINQLRGKTFQFSYRYIYFDWRKSTYAPPSIVAPANKEESTDGVPSSNPSLNNTINITINSGNEEVRAIEIIARDSDDPATWYKINEIIVIDDSSDYRKYAFNSNIVVKFYNDSSKTAVDPIEVYTLFSYVPIKAKHMEVLERNILSLGNITEGYGKINSSVSISLSWIDLNAISTSITNFQMDYERGDASVVLVARLPITSPGAALFKIRINVPTGQQYAGDNTMQYAYNGTDPYPSTVVTGLQAALVAEYGNILATCDYPASYQFCFFPEIIYPEEEPYPGWEYEGWYEIGGVTEVDKYQNLSGGFIHSWGIVYRDVVGRMSPVITSTSLKKYISFATENASIGIGRLPVLSFNISHNPPTWAESYEIVYAGNNSSDWFLYLTGYYFAMGKKTHTDPADLGTHSGNQECRINIKKAQSNVRDFYNNWSVEEYVWQKGDRIRIIGEVDEIGNLTEITSGIWDTEVTGVYVDKDYPDFSTGDAVDDTWVYFKNSNLITLTPGSPPSKNLYFQLYRTKSQGEVVIYYTTGMTFKILTNNYGFKYHEGNTNQVINSVNQSVTPAMVSNTSHDSWKYLRNFRDKTNALTWPLFAESQYCSDWYITQILTSSGFPIPAIDSLKQNVMDKRLRHGGNLNTGTQINNISKFDYDDYTDLKDEDGPIEGLRLIGFTLKVVQRTKLTSIFISRQESYNASGSPDYQFTNKVFGGVRPNEENWGTSHPDSVVTIGRNLYYWDQSEGVVVRDAPNGSFAISDYKMKRHFADLARLLDAEDKMDQWVVFAPSIETEELFCMFGIANGTKQIVTFREKDSRWKVIIDIPFINGLFYWLGKRLFHISQGNSYEWWVGSDYQSIGGVENVGKLVFYSIGSPIKPKIFNSIIVYQNGGEPEFESVIIPEKATSGEGEMETRIYPANTEKREGIYYCQVLRDINDPKPGTQNNKLSNGRVLRGIYAQITMLFTGSTKKTLSNVSVLTTPSERSR